MKIEKVTIKNIRGFQNQTIELDMIPNHPSILVAPNGTGKSSFATAFQSLRPRSLQVDKDEIFSNNDTFIPELAIKTDTATLVANPTQNDIHNEFAVFVINNQNKAKAITTRIAGTRVSTARMQVAPIILIHNIPTDVELRNTFIADNNLQNLVRGAVPSIDNLLNNNHFLDRLDISIIRDLVRPMRPINDFIQRLGTYTGRKVDIWEKITIDDIPLLSSVNMVESLVDYCRGYLHGENEAVIYLKVIQLIKLCLKDKSAFIQKIKYAQYCLEKDSYIMLFASLKHTWKNIHPLEVGRDFLIEIPNTEKLSNGERDIIVFLAMLQQARNTLTKENNILIIDEIFDYLDDANLIAAQYYISNLIDGIKSQGHNIFPIILSHLNPYYFKAYVFKGMKVYYLNPHKPMYSPKILKLLIRRDVLMRADKQNGTQTDLISKYMLHYHNDYSQDMAVTFGDVAELMPWRNIATFKQYCKNETDKYIAGQSYDSVAICVWLRECIEKYLYDNLPPDKKVSFLEEHGTNNKLELAEENAVDCPEVFSMLGLIYNDYLHLDNKSNMDSRETLYSRLENNTIREMIKKVVNSYPA